MQKKFGMHINDIKLNHNLENKYKIDIKKI